MTKENVIALVEAVSLLIIFLGEKYLPGLVADLLKAVALFFQPYFVIWICKLLGIEVLRAFRALK